MDTNAPPVDAATTTDDTAMEPTTPRGLREKLNMEYQVACENVSNLTREAELWDAARKDMKEGKANYPELLEDDLRMQLQEELVAQQIRKDKLEEDLGALDISRLADVGRRLATTGSRR